MTLAYTRSGNPDAAAIVFLHSLATGQWLWHAQVPHFADYDCYTVDLPGHGDSRAVSWESFDQAADAVAEILPDKPVSVVGLSLGAVVGLHLVTRHPRRIERAILTGAFDVAPARLLITAQGWILSALVSTRWGRSILARSLHVPSEVMPRYDACTRALSTATLRQITHQIAGYTPLAGLETVNVPLLFVTGEKDVPANRHSVARLTRQVPGAVGGFAPGVHHEWNGEDPALFNALARAFVEGRPLPDTLLPLA